MKKCKNLNKKRLAASMIMNWIGEAHHDVDCTYYNKMLPADKEMVKFYIHLYGIVIGRLLRQQYRPH